MRNIFVLVGLLLLAGGTAVAQDEFPRVETAPVFSYVHNAPVFGGSQSFNCAGGGGTMAVNITSLIGIAADLTDCKPFGLNNSYGVGSLIQGNEFTYVFGPRITFRNASRLQPFFEVNFGGERVSVSCSNGTFANGCGSVTAAQLPTGTTGTAGTTVVVNSNANSFSKNAFAMTVGGGLDLKLNRRVAIRLAQLDYLYTHFGNGCLVAAFCNENNGQSSFRLESGIVFAWGGK